MTDQLEALDYGEFDRLWRQRPARGKWRRILDGLEDGVPEEVTAGKNPSQTKTALVGAAKALAEETGHARFAHVRVVSVKDGDCTRLFACIPFPGDVESWEGRWSASLGTPEEVAAE